MVDINLSNIRRLDLNLLVAFLALYEERTVTGAARRLFVGQPAMSQSLGRLREIFGDELFVRVGQRMEPTPRAMELAVPIAEVLARVDLALSTPRGFDPKTADLTFRVGIVDGIELALVPQLVGILEREAPAARLSVRTVRNDRTRDLLDRYELDVAVGVTPSIGTGWQRSEVLIDHDFLAIFDPLRLPLRTPLTLDNYLAHPHVLMSPAGRFEGAIDDELQKLGRTRNVNFVASRFSTLAQVLHHTRRIATMPRLIALAYARCFELATSPLPFDSPRFTYTMLWHSRYDHDPAQRWLREQVRAIMQALENTGELISVQEQRSEAKQPISGGHRLG